MPASRRTHGERGAGGYVPGDSVQYDDGVDEEPFDDGEPGDELLDEESPDGESLDEEPDEELAGEEPERPRMRRVARREAPPRLTAATAGRSGLRYMGELTGKDIEGVTMVRPGDGGWTVEVEVVEDHRVPSSGDTLAIYAVDLDAGGDLVSYRRVRCFKRAKGDSGGAY
ncbi:gas vesicle protein [Sphaerisporangium corydalis]|uniref:Gas vesicle protein n=1 Tax=Sphaerisporangium corydalis TaxID=1441875 RepID=A0ABV9EFA3_9ACTN|nr:gas vesicle protein [Sphaerisporangium corydalis]